MSELIVAEVTYKASPDEVKAIFAELRRTSDKARRAELLKRLGAGVKP